MIRRSSLLLIVLLVGINVAHAQRVDPRNTFFRAWVIDHVVVDDNNHRMPAHAAGKMGFVAVYGSGGASSLCLVEYVAEHDADLDSVRQDKDTVKFFDKAHTPQAAFRAVAKTVGFTDADVDRFFAAYVRVK